MNGPILALAAVVTIAAGCGGKNTSAMHDASTSGEKMFAAEIAPLYRTIKVGWTAKQVEHVYGPQHKPSSIGMAIDDNEATHCWVYKFNYLPSYTFCFNAGNRMTMKAKGL